MEFGQTHSNALERAYRQHDLQLTDTSDLSWISQTSETDCGLSLS